MRASRHIYVPVILVGSAIVAGCASAPRPMEEITRANTLVEAADKGGNAPRYAAGDLQRAHDELADANRADTAGKYEEAKNFAESAAVDANLAAARGAAGDAKRAATEVVQSNATLRGEANRAVDNSIATPARP